MAILSVLFMTFFAKSNLSKFHFLSLNNLDSITIYSLCCLKMFFFVLVDNKPFMETCLSLFLFCCVAPPSRTTVPTRHRRGQQPGSVNEVRVSVFALERRVCVCKWSFLTCEVMAAKKRQVNESAVISSLRRFRDRYFPNTGKVLKDGVTPNDAAEPCQPGYFDSLPVRQCIPMVDMKKNNKVFDLVEFNGIIFVSAKILYFDLI